MTMTKMTDAIFSLQVPTIVQLLKTKCLPVLLYCLEACPLKKSQLNAVDFALNCAFRKIFFHAFSGMCNLVFSCQTPSDAVANRKCKFCVNFWVSLSCQIMCCVTCLRMWQWKNCWLLKTMPVI